MSDQATSSAVAGNYVSPVRKNPKGKFVSSRQKETIINVYKAQVMELPNLKSKELIKIVSKITGVGTNTISRTISDYKNKRVIKSPNKTKCRTTISEKINGFEKNAVRRKIHNFWFQRQIPTLKKTVISVNEDPNLINFSRTTLYGLIKDMNFVFTNKGRNSAIIEKDEIVCWRNKYLEQLRKYRAEGRKIYYLNETWVNAEDVTSRVGNTVKSSKDASLKSPSTSAAAKPSRTGQRLIAMHIGSEDGFVPGGLLSFESKKNTSDYHDEINDATFLDWFKSVVPLLENNCVILMDNAPYHNAQTNLCPTCNWKKSDIENWLEEKGQVFQKHTIKVRLMELVKRFKPDFNQYVIDEYAKEHNMVVLRLPPYHGELNPINLAWSEVKKHVETNNTTFKLQDVQKLILDGVNLCTPEMWKNFVEHTKKEEERFWKIDFIVDEVMDHKMGSTVRTNTREMSSLSSDYDSGSVK